MVEPNKKLLDRTLGIPTIRVADLDWPVPKLSPRQNEVAVPVILELWPKIMDVKEATDLKSQFTALAQVLNKEGLQKVNDCVFVALQKGHPDLTREYFDEELGVGVLDAVEALSVIGQQTGLIKVVTRSAGPPAGEAPAETSQTGEQ